jgi:hypothetical protein
LLSQKGSFLFSTLRLLISPLESRLALRLALQKLDVSCLACPLMLLLSQPGSEIYLVSETTWRVSHFARIHRDGFFLRR